MSISMSWASREVIAEDRGEQPDIGDIGQRIGLHPGHRDHAGAALLRQFGDAQRFHAAP